MTADPHAVVDEYAPKLRSNLREQVIDFWLPRCLDEEHAGYLLSYDRAGEFAGNDAKMIVTQARMVWFFSNLTRSEHVEGSFLDEAELGYDFLVEEMWDDDHGGFYWEVTRTGEATKPNKHLYGQTFGIYALAEYARATGDDEPLERAHDLFDLLEAEAYDDEYGGYVEYFTPDWEPIETGTTYLENIEPDWSPKESDEGSLDPTLKLMNTHLHLLEGFTTLYEAGGRDDVRERLHELLVILTNTVVRKDLGACTDKYSPEWEARLDREEFRVVSYGHDVEAVWLVMEACDALDVPATLFEELFDTLYDYSLEYGYDDEHGGFYFYGPFDAPASNRIKAWWVQAEAIVSALKTYRLTENPRYLDVFTETYDFVDEYQIDREHGEWHSGVDEDLQPVGRKGAAYKAAYHDGRALLESLSVLDSLA